MTKPPAMPEPLGWYVVNNIGMATLCADEAEAKLLAEDCDMVYQRQAPHRAVQLVALAALQSAQPAAAVSDESAYNLIDRFLRNNLHDDDYAEYSQALDILTLRPQAVPMTPEQMHDAYKQAPDSKNCMQCAAAYMLGLPMAAVPDFEKAGPDAWESFYAFFADHGFTAEMFPPTAEIDGDYLASGDTSRGTSHMVVMRGGKLLHDPHPSNAGLKSVQVVWLITRRAGCRDGITQRADGAHQPAKEHP